MRVGHLNVTRPQYYDRIIQTISISAANAGVAPHGGTVRATYTTPTGVRTHMDILSLAIARRSNATSEGLVENKFVFTPSGGSALAILRTVLDINAGVHADAHVGQAGIMVSGDKLELTDFDPSTGGSVSYSGATKLCEFQV